MRGLFKRIFKKKKKMLTKDESWEIIKKVIFTKNNVLAIKLLDQVITCSLSKDMIGQAYYYKGYRLERLGQYNKALDALNKSINMDPMNLETSNSYYIIGLMFFNRGKYKKALDAFEKCLDNKPDYKEAIEYRNWIIENTRYG